MTKERGGLQTYMSGWLTAIEILVSCMTNMHMGLSVDTEGYEIDVLFLACSSLPASLMCYPQVADADSYTILPPIM